MLKAERFADGLNGVTDILSLDYEERKRSRFTTRLPGGDEVLVALPPGTVLRHGDRIVAHGSMVHRIIEIRAALETLAEVRENDAMPLARAAYHLGNRHVALELGKDDRGCYLRFRPDHVLEDMLICRGYALFIVREPFQPEGGAYGHHSHSPGTGADKPSATIHEFR